MKFFILLLSFFSLGSMQGKVAKVNGIDIWYETFGKKEDPAALLIMGGCCQGVLWDRTFCEKLANSGFFVIRYDHRDTGLSTCFDYEKNPYDLMDMTRDAAQLLETLGIKKAHLFGVSMGSIISEMMAAYFPKRVSSLLLMGSTCDIRPMNRAYAGLPVDENISLPPPSSHYVAWMMEFMKLSPKTDEEKLNHRLEGWNRLNGDIIPLDEKSNREMHKAFLSRLRHPQGIVNHVKMLREKSSENYVQNVPSLVKVPTIVLHGSEDPIFTRAHGEALADKINADFYFIEGMGHIPNDGLYDFYIEILKRQKEECKYYS